MGNRGGPGGHGSRWLAASTGDWSIRRQNTDGSEVGGLGQSGGPGEDGVFGFSFSLGEKPGWLRVDRQMRMPGKLGPVEKLEQRE